MNIGSDTNNPTVTTNSEPSSIPPVSAEDLKKLGDLQSLRLQACERFTDLELEKIRQLRVIQDLDNQRQSLFSHLMAERGIPLSSGIEIDSVTGVLTIAEAPAIG